MYLHCIYSKTVDGCAPLFLACKNGSAEVVEYLLTRCSAPVEQKGLFEVTEFLCLHFFVSSF